MNKVHISEKMLKFHEMITLRIILTTVKINIKTLSLSLCGVCGVVRHGAVRCGVKRCLLVKNEVRGKEELCGIGLREGPPSQPKHHDHHPRVLNGHHLVVHVQITKPLVNQRDLVKN